MKITKQGIDDGKGNMIVLIPLKYQDHDIEIINVYNGKKENKKK